MGLTGIEATTKKKSGTPSGKTNLGARECDTSFIAYGIIGALALS